MVFVVTHAKKRRKMLSRVVVVLVVVACLGMTQAVITLGPKDGLDLPPADLDRVKAGSLAPDFTLESKDGHAVTLSDFRGKKNVILVFYRGHW
jgi:cytochrome oxidase Cu insertion factor (SCO1/SenC/PrrC family)